MLNIDLLNEVAKLSGYTIAQTTGDDVTNKARAQRRLNLIRADITSRYSAKWTPQYREGWLALVPIYNTGTATFTNASRTITGSGTVWTSAMVGAKITGPDTAQYKIASVQSSTSLTITEPFQGTSAAGNTYQIWQDEYTLYPEVHALGGFVDYQLPDIASEAWQKPMKESYPASASNEEPTVYTLIGRKNWASYSTGTVSGSAGSYTLTGSGTSWLDNVKPGFELLIGTLYYHVRTVDSDTQITLYQQIKTAITAGTTYTANGKNATIIRFRNPTTQRAVQYWYWAKAYPLVNDSDEDWISELYPRVIVQGIMYYDYIDKNDVARAGGANSVYEDSIKNMRVSHDGAYTGVRTLGLYIPASARE